MLPSACLPLRMRRYVQKSKLDYFSPDSNVVAYGCKPFRDRQADRWDISLSDIAVDPICRTFLDSRCKEDPGNRWKNRESRIQAFVVPVGISGEPGISYIISCRNMPGRIYTGGYAYFRKYRIDGIGTALILVFAVWTAALTVFLITMLPQLQMLMVAVLRMMKKLRAILTTG